MWLQGAWACTCAYVYVVLLIQQATRMRHIVTSFVASRSAPHFSTLSLKRYDFREKVIEHKMCAFIFSTTLSKTFLILRGNKRGIVKNVETSLCKVPAILAGFLMKIEFSRRIFETKLKYQISSKSLKWEPSCSTRTAGRTDRRT